MKKERKEFYENIRKEAKEFRRKKIKEIMEKENPTEMEISIIKSWTEYYGEETH